MSPRKRPPRITWRIRAILPSVHTDRELAQAERETGLPIIRVYQGLWSAADREGRFPWLLDELQRGILPWDYDRWPIEKVLDALVRGGWVVRYEADGMTWGLVPRFGEYQHPNAREKASVYPEPPAGVVESWERAYRPGSAQPAPVTTDDDASPPVATCDDPSLTDADATATRRDASAETAQTHVHARARTCIAPLGTRNLEPEEGGEELATTLATPGAAAAPPEAIPPPVGLSGPRGSTAPLLAAAAGRRRRGGAPPAEPPDRAATAVQLAMLAAMAVERGTTLPAQLAALGITGAVPERRVTHLRARLEAMPRLPADQIAGGGTVLWSDLKAMLDADHPLDAEMQLRGLTANKHRTELWRRVEQYCLERLPSDVSPESVLIACGVESIRDDLPRIWSAVQAIRGGDRSMLPVPEPETEEWQRARLLIPRLPAAIRAKGNGSSEDMLQQFEAALSEWDAGVIMRLAERVGLQEAAT